MIRLNSPFVINSLRQLGGTVKTQMKITSSLVAHLCGISNSATVPVKPMGQSANFVPRPAGNGSTPAANAFSASPVNPTGLSDRLKPLLSDMQLRPEIAVRGSERSRDLPPLSSAMIDQLVDIIKNDEASFDRTDWRLSNARPSNPPTPVRQAPPPPPPPMPDFGFNRSAEQRSGPVQQKSGHHLSRPQASRPQATLSVMAELEQRIKNSGKRIPDEMDSIQKIHLTAKRHLSAPAALSDSQPVSQPAARAVKSETFSHQAMLDELRQTFASLGMKK